MKKELTKKVEAVRNSLNQEIKAYPKWVKIAVTILLATGFFLTAACVVVAVKKFKKKD